jgi:hypothetical protein
MRTYEARFNRVILKGTKMKATAKLSTATINAIGAWSGKSREADNSKVKAIDALFADGVTSAMLAAPAKGESTVLFDSVKVSIVMGFTVATQALLKKDTKGLSEAKKEEKRYWQQQIGSKMKDLRNALTRREAQAKAEMAGSNGAGEKKASWESVKRTVIADIIKQAQGKEASAIKDMASFIKDLQSALARIPANA